jgi:hypothetical protein
MDRGVRTSYAALMVRQCGIPSSLKAGRLARPLSVAACVSRPTCQRRPSQQKAGRREPLEAPAFMRGRHHLVPFGEALVRCSHWPAILIIKNCDAVAI